MVKDHSDSEKGNPLPPHRLLLSINRLKFRAQLHSVIENIQSFSSVINPGLFFFVFFHLLVHQLNQAFILSIPFGLCLHM